MRLLWLVLLAACGKPQPPAAPPAARTREELAKQLHAFATLVKTTRPAIGDAAFVRPPSDAELAWVNDRSVPVADRIQWASDMFDDERMILHAYADPLVAEAAAHPDTAKDTPEVIAWGEANARSFAHLVDVMLDEFLPTVSRTDGKFENRVHGIQQMEAGALGMMQGMMITLQARRVDVGLRRELLAAWTPHIATYRKLWSADDCAKIVSWAKLALLPEHDETLVHGLQQLISDLETCTGGSW